ncbi:hypothetical protein SALBM311S_03095 [Streptomyces alboniger]
MLTGDPVTLDRVRGRQQLGAGWVARVLQRAVLRLWSDGALDPAAVAAAYRGRRDLLIDALAERGVRAYGRSGLNVRIPVPDETGAVSRLLHAGWAVAPGARFRLNAPRHQGHRGDPHPGRPDRWRTRSPPPSARAWSGVMPSRRRRCSPRRDTSEAYPDPGSGSGSGAGAGRCVAQDLVLGRARVSAAPARTIAAPTGADQLSDSPRIATPAAVATTGMKYVTI